MIYFRKLKYAAEMTYKAYINDKHLRKNHQLKEYLELFIELFKCCE